MIETYNELGTEERIVAEKIISELNKKTIEQIDKGYGPFRAAIYDRNGNKIAERSNSVMADCCSNCHAEINTIAAAQKALNTYDLAPLDLGIYITAEPCSMCAGAIMWSGIKRIYFSVTTKDVEKITGFDEGYKPDWIKAFNKRGISVYGEIMQDEGQKILQYYVDKGLVVYNPGSTVKN